MHVSALFRALASCRERMCPAVAALVTRFDPCFYLIRYIRSVPRYIRKAQRAARAKKTITKLPKATRQDLGRQAAKARQRGGKAGRALEDRTRQQLYEVAKKRGVPGRSKMGKWDLIEAIRQS